LGPDREAFASTCTNAMKTALTISGSDSSGGSGIQADLKTFSVLGIYGMTALTAVTVQNTQGIRQVLELESDLVRQQIDAVAGDIEIEACKTGLLANAKTIETIEECLKRNKLIPYVCDPTLFARGGKRLLDEAGVEMLLNKLLPLATLVTPSLAEAGALTGVDARTLTGIPAVRDVCRRLVDAGAKGAVVKGLASAEQIVDIYFDGREFLEFAGKIQPKEKSYGSGDSFSAAITAGLAKKMTMTEAIDQAKSLVNMAIQYSDGQGRGTAPVNVLAFAPKKK
jgi:hydroxymethylpyrimidine/phosphomethylpyrimidine kinase